MNEGNADRSASASSDDFSLSADDLAQGHLAYRFGQLRRAAHAVFDCVYTLGADLHISQIRVEEGIHPHIIPARKQEQTLKFSLGGGDRLPLANAARSAGDSFSPSYSKNAVVEKLDGNLHLKFGDSLFLNLKITGSQKDFSLTTAADKMVADLNCEFFTRSEDERGFTKFDTPKCSLIRNKDCTFIAPVRNFQAGELILTVAVKDAADIKIIHFNFIYENAHAQY